MQQLADYAGISKSLVFHYFRNKQILYEWLLQEALGDLESKRTIVYEDNMDFFELLSLEIKQKYTLIQELPLQYLFVIRVYEEQLQKGNKKIQSLMESIVTIRKQKTIDSINMGKFRRQEDVELLYDIVFDIASSFYIKNDRQLWYEGNELLIEFNRYMDSLKNNYYI